MDNIIANTKSSRIVESLNRQMASGQLFDEGGVIISNNGSNEESPIRIESLIASEMESEDPTPEFNPSGSADKPISDVSGSAVNTSTQQTTTSAMVTSNAESNSGDTTLPPANKSTTPEKTTTPPPDSLKGFIFDYKQYTSLSLPSISTVNPSKVDKRFSSLVAWYSLNEKNEVGDIIKITEGSNLKGIDLKDKLRTVSNGWILDWSKAWIKDGQEKYKSVYVGTNVVGYDIPTTAWQYSALKDSNSIITEFGRCANKLGTNIQSPIDSALLLNSTSIGILNTEYPFHFNNGEPLHQVIQNINRNNNDLSFHSGTTKDYHRNIPSWKDIEFWCGFTVIASAKIAQKKASGKLGGTGQILDDTLSNDAETLKFILGKHINTDGTLTTAGFDLLEKMKNSSPTGAIIFRNTPGKGGHVEMITQIRVNHKNELVIGTIGGNTGNTKTAERTGVGVYFKLYIGKDILGAWKSNVQGSVYVFVSYSSTLISPDWNNLYFKESPKIDPPNEKYANHNWYYGFQPKVIQGGVLEYYINSVKANKKNISNTGILNMFARPMDYIPGISGTNDDG